MNDKFIVINLIKKLINDFDAYLVNFPNKNIELKREIMNTSLDMLKISIEGNTTYDINKRIDIQDKVITYIKYLDYLVNVCYDKKIINSKKYIKFGQDLDGVFRYVIRWRNVSRNEKVQ